ncbi:MAG: hypothetical protein PHN90_03900 [Methanothrix sp.]|nr:hypothetical protein [Methanothrix sp.]HNR56956.1 hypothetical protein [Methanothrix sp.]
MKRIATPNQIQDVCAFLKIVCMITPSSLITSTPNYMKVFEHMSREEISLLLSNISSSSPGGFDPQNADLLFLLSPQGSLLEDISC